MFFLLLSDLLFECLFLSFDLSNLAFCNSLFMKGAWFAQAYFVCNGAREFKIWRQESWKPFRLLSFGNKSLSLDRNSSRNKRLSKFLYFWWTINLGFCFSKWVFKILKVQFQLWQNFGNNFGYIGDPNQKDKLRFI